jgi:hypothetical protein
MMRLNKLLAAMLTALALPAAMAGVYPQCPDEVKALGVNQVDPVSGLTMTVYAPANGNRKVCVHVVGGDGWMVLGDGRQAYGFGFSPAQGEGEEVMINGTAAAKFPAPMLTFREGDEVWISLTNVGMIHRPDLFDSHSVHWHGFPQASTVFDGVPNASATVQMGSTITYYYKVNDAGTYFWHCHVEATEHLEMGMYGMLNVEPKQNGTQVTASNGKQYTKFAYNDVNGDTGYDKEFSLQLGGVDANFHELHELVQPLPFLELKSDFAQMNGRSYPLTTIENQAAMLAPPDAPAVSQQQHAVLRATAGERLLLRVSNMSVDSHYTVTALGVPMQVIGRGAQIARGQPQLGTGGIGKSWAHGTASFTLGGGEGTDLLLDTAGVAPGTYYLYTTNLNYLSNGASEDRGGLMTTIVLQ